MTVLTRALLLIPVAALRNGEFPESLALDAAGTTFQVAGFGCDEEATLRQLLLDLGHRGPFDGHHCDWPGIECEWQRCRVDTLQCETCGGHLPSHFDLKDPRSVKLTSPNLTGDIKAFEGATSLKYLLLQGTQVSGDLQVLSKLKRLEHLSLADTKVFGNLQVCGAGPGFALEELDLSGTAVTGDLKDLGTGLVRLKLSRTAVTGQLSNLIDLFKIEEVDLSFTQISGHITSQWRGMCRGLTTLQLQNSLVKFVPDGEELKQLKEHHTAVGAHIFFKLKNLDLTNCPVNSPAENLLLPLAMSPITSIKAVGAKITGEVPKLKDAEGMVDGKHTNLTFALAETLLMLDLTGNDVGELRDLPVKPNLGRVLVRENHRLKLQPEVLTQALREKILLDLSGTKLSNGEVVAQLLEEGALQTTDMYALRNDAGGFACKDLVGTVKVTPSMFLPNQLCKCLPGWHGHGATCQICPADKFSDEMGLDTCKLCPSNSTAPAGSTKLADCKCDFGNLHNGTCSCDKHHALQNGDCVLCSKLHLHCDAEGSLASTAAPDVKHARLIHGAEEARRCLPPDVLQRCPGSHECGRGYSGTLCTSCSEGYWAKQGKCKPCAKAGSTTAWCLVLLGVAILLVAAWLGYRRVSGPQAARAASVKRQLQKLMILQAPGLLQIVQLWTVLSQLGKLNESSSRFPEITYLAALQLTIDDFQTSLNLECHFDAETLRVLAALSSPLLPLLLLACCAGLELCRGGLGVNMALKVLPFLFIGGTYSTASLLSCQREDGDGESLGDFAFRKALPQLRCYDRSGVGFWVDAVGYGSALAYGVLIPLCWADGATAAWQYFALQQARLFCACATGEPHHMALRLEPLHGQLPNEGLPKRLLASVAAYMAVNCRGRRVVQLLDGYITTTSIEKDDVEEIHSIQELSVMKVVADAETARNIDVLRARKLTEMLTERIMLEEAQDRLLIGSQSLLCKYALSQDVWIYVVLKLFAVALVCCISISDAWKWAIAFSLGMALLVGVGQPYMWPQVSQLQSFSCVCLAVASVAFAYDFPWLARLGLLAPLLLLLWQVRSPDCTEALAERLYQELQSELPKLQRGESHEVIVQQLRFADARA
eukprot:s109_g16.t2